MRVYLIRHGQSANNLSEFKKTSRVEDPDLTPIGYQQAERLAAFMTSYCDPYPVGEPENLSVEGSYALTDLICSPMRRALRTVLPLANATGITPIVWEDIHESGGIWLAQDDLSPTCLQGMTSIEIGQDFPDYILPAAITENGWWNRDRETIDEAKMRANRVAQKLHDMAKLRPDAVVGIVAHQHFIALTLHALLGNPASMMKLFHYNTAYARLDFSDDGFVRMRYMNRFDHVFPDFLTT